MIHADRTGKSPAARDEAEKVAIAALAFIAGDERLLQRFVGITGIEPGRIREAARQPGFLAGVVHFILAHEPTLTAFCAESGIPAASVAAAEQALPLGRLDRD